VLAAIDNRDGSRWYFACFAVLVVLTGALIYWWRSQFAPMRVDLTDNGQILSIVTRRVTTQIPVAALTWIDQQASPVAQLFAWRELRLHHFRGRIRMGRPQDTRDFYWQLGRLNRALPPEPPPTEQRPWIVAVAVGIVALSAGAAIAFALEVVASRHGGGVNILGLVLMASGMAQLALCYLLWAGYRRAWRFFMVLVVSNSALTLMWSHYTVIALCFQLVGFIVLTSPGVRRWVSD
jgi:hypothetical protein